MSPIAIIKSRGHGRIDVEQGEELGTRHAHHSAEGNIWHNLDQITALIVVSTNFPALDELGYEKLSEVGVGRYNIAIICAN